MTPRPEPDPTMRPHLALLVPILTLAACGRSTNPTPPAEVARLRALASTIVNVTAAYGARAASMADATACRADRSEYEARVGPAVEGLLALSPALDRWTQVRGPSEHADAGCAAAAMLAEFERHTDIACTSLDVAANRAETAGHVLVMDRWADLVLARVDEPAAGGARGPRCVRFDDGGRMYLP